jgi:hypothetical protein
LQPQQKKETADRTEHDKCRDTDFAVEGKADITIDGQNVR